MVKTRGSRLLVLCISTVLVFLAQSMMCFATELGLAPCCDRAEHTQSPDGDHKHEPAPSSECSGCVCSHGTVMPEESSAFCFGSLGEAVLLWPDETAPDGPVYEIEYPPQLS